MSATLNNLQGTYDRSANGIQRGDSNRPKSQPMTQRVLALALETRQKHSASLRSIASVARSLQALGPTLDTALRTNRPAHYLLQFRPSEGHTTMYYCEPLFDLVIALHQHRSHCQSGRSPFSPNVYSVIIATPGFRGRVTCTYASP